MKKKVCIQDATPTCTAMKKIQSDISYFCKSFFVILFFNYLKLFFNLNINIK